MKDESSDSMLFSGDLAQQEGPLYYKERSHFRAFLRKILKPVVFLGAPILFVLCVQRIIIISGHWIDTNNSYVAEQFAYARSKWDMWMNHLSPFEWIWQVVMTIWILLILYLFVKSYYDWIHEYRSISTQYVIDAEKKLLQSETSNTIETTIVVGIGVRRTLFDKFFPKCGSVVIKTKDLEGNDKSIQFQDVVDPYRMRDVILEVRRTLQSDGQ